MELKSSCHAVSRPFLLRVNSFTVMNMQTLLRFRAFGYSDNATAHLNVPYPCVAVLCPVPV